MGTERKTAGYHRNAARRRKTIFKKCEELSRLGVDLWIIIGSTDQTHVFKSRDRGLFDRFDRQVMLSCARPKWQKAQKDILAPTTASRRVRIIDRLRADHSGSAIEESTTIVK
ncbi:hypothetical protein AWENTII_003164 [Aspergillus wentii]